MWVEGSKRQEIKAASLETETVLFVSYFIVLSSHRTQPLSRGEGMDRPLDEKSINWWPYSVHVSHGYHP